MRVFEVISQPINEGPNDPYIFKAVFMAGGPGSGKSYVAGRLLGGYPGLKMLNSDDVYEIFMKKAGMELDPASIFSPQGQEIRDRAKQTSATQDELYKLGRLGMIIDGTGKDAEKIAKLKARLDALGYDTMMIYVNTSLDVAQERNSQRQRSLDPKEVEKMWSAVQNNIGRFQRMFGNDMIIFDSTDGFDAEPDQVKDAESKIRSFLSAPVNKKQAKDWIANADKTNANFGSMSRDEKKAAVAATKKPEPVTEPEVKQEAITEEQFDEAAGEKDACYHKVKSRYKVWPSAYASGALSKCRKVGAKNWGNKSKD